MVAKLDRGISIIRDHEQGSTKHQMFMLVPSMSVYVLKSLIKTTIICDSLSNPLIKSWVTGEMTPRDGAGVSMQCWIQGNKRRGAIMPGNNPNQGRHLTAAQVESLASSTYVYSHPRRANSSNLATEFYSVMKTTDGQRISAREDPVCRKYSSKKWDLLHSTLCAHYVTNIPNELQQEPPHKRTMMEAGVFIDVLSRLEMHRSQTNDNKTFSLCVAIFRS